MSTRLSFVKAALLLLPISLITVPDVSFHRLVLRSASCAPPSAALPAPPLAHLTDLSLAPLLWPGVAAGTASSAHERESDFSAFLYAERGRLFFFDQAGPVCLTRLFYATSGDLVWEGWGFFERAVLHVEVDGVPVLAAPAEELFNHTLSWPPAPLSAYVPGFFSRAGNVLLAPVCAERRLRLSWDFPVGAGDWSVDEAQVRQAQAGEGGVSPATLALLHSVTSAEDLLLHSDACVAKGDECLLKLYFDAGFVSLPGVALPRGWAPFEGARAPTAPSPPPPPPAPPVAARTHARGHGRGGGAPPAPPPAPTAAAAAALPVSFPSALAAATAASEPALTRTTCFSTGDEWGRLRARGGAPIFSADGGGTVLAVALEADAPAAGSSDAPHALLHSFRVSLAGHYDVAPGAFDGREGGALLAPLGSLFGPAHIGYGKDAVPLAPSAQQALAAFDLNGTAAAAHLLLPAPFWFSAHLALVADADFEAPAGEGVRLCASVLATRAVYGAPPPPPPFTNATSFARTGAPPPSCGAGLDEPRGAAGAAVGYLQARPYDFFVKPGEENPLLRVSGTVGKLVAVTSLLEARRGDYPMSLVEGDVRARVDGGRSPATWDTGYEDFFNGAHTYEFDVARTGEPLFAHQRRDTERWMAHANAGCINAGGVCPPWLAKLHPDIDTWSMRHMALDALPFLHSLDLTLEGFYGQFEMAQLRGAAIFYGRAASGAPLASDAVHPGAEYYSPAGERRHGYGVALAGGGAAVGRYDHTSAFAGGGEPGAAEDGACPLRQPGAGGGGIAYINCPAPLLTLPVLLLPPGAVASFHLRVDPRAARVALRRTWDARRAGAEAELRLDGAPVARLLAAARAFSSYNTDWREAVVHLPPALTRGRALLQLSVHVGVGRAAEGRVYPPSTLGGEWTEAGWAAVCFYD